MPDSPEHSRDSTAPRQVVLLGASNVTIGFPCISRLLRAAYPAALDIRAAIGHGRSFGNWSHFAGRSLPGIRDCGLWDSLDQVFDGQRRALITDIGNDLLYGVSPEEIAAWVGECVQRLANHDFRCLITRPPVSRLERLTAMRYHATRLLFFPRHRPISWTNMLARVHHLDEAITQIARASYSAILTPSPEWYGFDPIHIRRGVRPAAWNHILSHWPDFSAVEVARQNPIRLLGRFPHESRWLGIRRLHRQPVEASGNCSLSLF